MKIYHFYLSELWQQYSSVPMPSPCMKLKIQYFRHAREGYISYVRQHAYRRLALKIQRTRKIFSTKLFKIPCQSNIWPIGRLSETLFEITHTHSPVPFYSSFNILYRKPLQGQNYNYVLSLSLSSSARTIFNHPYRTN